MHIPALSDGDFSAMLVKTTYKIIIGDSRKMDGLRDESVHLVITSPPYRQLKDYGVSCQIGFNDSYESYINNLNLVWNECRRVLHKGCRLCINIGDQFARAVYYGKYKVIPIRTEIIKFCETIGFDYMGAIIWQKVTTSNTTGGATIMGSYPYPRNGILKLDYEFILIFKKDGDVFIYGSRNDKDNTDYEELITKLPYIFKDPHNLNKKIDLKKLQFGSKIDKNSKKREEYFTVKEVLSPEFIKLNNGLTVRLLGVKPKAVLNGEALSYLVKKLRGQKVFLRYDSLKYDNKNNLLCYLYLQNKTFINAHLVKEGLVSVDTNTDFKYKERFINMTKEGHAEN